MQRNIKDKHIQIDFVTQQPLRSYLMYKIDIELLATYPYLTVVSSLKSANKELL